MLPFVAAWWPDQHGITGNSYFDERSRREEYMESADLLLAPTPSGGVSRPPLHEMDVPLLVYNAHAQLKPEQFQYNRDLARWLYAG